MVNPSPTVYSYYMPEVETVVANAIANLNSTRGIHRLLTQNYQPGLDDLHLPLMEKYEAFARSEGVIGLDTFENKWFTNGSSEGIFHLLADLPEETPLYQMDGEYQGYKGFADALGRKIETVKRIDDFFNLPPGVVVLSNPASKDGNMLGALDLRIITGRHQVILDLAYMGMTRKPLNMDLTDRAVIAAVGSLSKPFGMYYYRVGFCYARKPVASLYGNVWFKNALSILIAERVLDHFDPRRLGQIKDTYFAAQEKAVATLNNDESYNLDNLLAGHSTRKAQPSDVWLLAHAPLRDWNPDELEPFKRGEQNYRFCLTPYYMENRNG